MIQWLADKQHAEERLDKGLYEIHQFLAPCSICGLLICKFRNQSARLKDLPYDHIFRRLPFQFGRGGWYHLPCKLQIRPEPGTTIYIDPSEMAFAHLCILFLIFSKVVYPGHPPLGSGTRPICNVRTN